MINSPRTVAVSVETVLSTVFTPYIRLLYCASRRKLRIISRICRYSCRIKPRHSMICRDRWRRHKTRCQYPRYVSSRVYVSSLMSLDRAPWEITYPFPSGSAASSCEYDSRHTCGVFRTFAKLVCRILHLAVKRTVNPVRSVRTIWLQTIRRTFERYSFMRIYMCAHARFIHFLDVEMIRIVD